MAGAYGNAQTSDSRGRRIYNSGSSTDWSAVPGSYSHAASNYTSPDFVRNTNDLMAGSHNLFNAMLGNNQQGVNQALGMGDVMGNQQGVPGRLGPGGFTPGDRDNHGDPTQDLGGGTNEAYEDGYGGTGDTPMSDPDWGDPPGDNVYQPVDEQPWNEPWQWPDFPDININLDIPDWDIPDQNFEFEDFPEDPGDFPEFEKAKRNKFPMGFYDAGSTAAGFSGGDLKINPEDFLAAQVAEEAGVIHPLKQALLGR